jgi:hypothetical protein
VRASILRPDEPSQQVHRSRVTIPLNRDRDAQRSFSRPGSRAAFFRFRFSAVVAFQAVRSKAQGGVLLDAALVNSLESYAATEETYR